MYPSISICKKYSFEYEMFDEDDFEGVNDTDDVSSRVESMIKNFSYYSLDLDDQVYFFSQPAVLNMTYPCTTTLAGTSPGRPCIFPVRWKFTLPAKYALYYGYDYINVTNCKPWDADVAAYLGRTFKHLGGGRCYTKAYENNTVDSNTGSDAFWGVCPPSCKGEVLSPSSPYNLAKQKYISLWRSALYDLKGFDNGLCHTYNPPENSEIDFSKRIFFMIPRNLNHYQDYDIFLHERGQFWPRSDMISYGQQESVTITNNTELQISFSIKKVKKISTEERPCVMDEEYSFTTCLQEYVIKQTNCSLHLFGQESKKTKICSKKAFLEFDYGHAGNIRNKNQKGTRLSRHVWELKNNQPHPIPFEIEWDILGREKPYNPVTGVCRLCLLEAFILMFDNVNTTLNSRFEYWSSCPHRRKYLLANS